MQFLSWTFIRGRLKAIKAMMKDKNVPKRKKALIIFGIIYLFLPVDLIPPVLFPIGFLDDLVLWIWIIWHLKDTLDEYWIGEKTVDYSKNFEKSNLIEDVEYSVDEGADDENSNDEDPKNEGSKAENLNDEVTNEEGNPESDNR